MWRALLNHSETEQQATKSLPEADSKSVPSGSQTPPSNRKKKKEKMELIKSLVSKRGQAKGKLTRIWNSLQVPHEEEPIQVSLPQLKVHQRSIEKYYGEFMEVHDKVMEVIPENQRDEHENKLLEFEDLYNSTLVLIETLLTDRAAVGHSQLLVPAGQGVPPQPQVIVHQQSLRAPLPVFDGKYENWPKFKSMWTDLMKTSPDSNAVKLFHLEKSLVGQAAGIIDTKTIQDNNYEHAWAMLEERFENERRLIDIHIEGLLKLKKMEKKSSHGLRELITECSRHVENLRFHNQDLLGVSELFVVHLLASALDRETRELWEASIDHGDLPKYDETMEFLKKRCQVLERCEATVPVALSAKPMIKLSSVKGSPKVSSTATTTSETVCELCGGSHPNFKCSAFREMGVAQRLIKAKQMKVCFNCLRKGHRSAKCLSERSCSKCNQKHHTLLHQEEENQVSVPASKPGQQQVEPVKSNANITSTPDAKGPTEERDSSSVNSSCLSSEPMHLPQQVLLQTAIIDVADKYGRMHPCRALLDSGSQAHILSQSMANILELPTAKCNVTVVGANALKTQARKKMCVSFSSKYGAFTDAISCLISEQPTGKVPWTTIDISGWDIPIGIQLADPHFFEPSEIDLVLASNYVWDLLRNDNLKLANGTVSLRETDLGWIVTGAFDPFVQADAAIICSNVVLEDPLSKAVERFWSVEEITDSSPLSTEEQEVELHYARTFRRDENGRFIVQLPFRDTVMELEDNRTLALRRFHQLERRFLRSPELKRHYSDFIDEYEALEHCKEVCETDDDPNLKKFYLPHHAVLKPSSSSTKLRVVFNASAKTSTYSLNDVLKVGPTVQADLFSIVLRFRRHLVAFSGDITKMYRQVRLDDSQTAFQRIFWRKETSDPLRVLELSTVTYGTATAPFLATRCLVQLASEEKQRFPVAADIVIKDVYVDDLLSGADTEEEAVQRLQEVKQLLAAGCFPIRKWSSNSEVVINSVPEEDREKLISVTENELNNTSEVIKALGVLWEPQKDTLLFVGYPIEAEGSLATKRSVLSSVSKLFDPLGLVSPVIVLAKTLIQKLWANGVDWDEELKGDVLSEWSKFRAALPGLGEISVPRCVVVKGACRYEIHGFCDASLVAYGACVYIRSINADGSAELRLCCAKSRVAPLKAVTIPRMELLAAVLLSRLTVKVVEEMAMGFSDIVLWSDSQIVLAWLRKSPGSMEVYVRNRVVQINSLTGSWSWKYVRTDSNPADIVSRGMLPSALVHCDLWWHGPQFLRCVEDELVGPELRSENSDMLITETMTVQSVVVEEVLPILGKCDNFRRLQRVIGYVLRFIKNCKCRVAKQPTLRGPILTVCEMRNAMKHIVKMVQRSELPEEFDRLRRIRPSRRLASLHPFLDEDGLLRVGGRLENAKLPYDARHQLIMPNHSVTDALIRSLHVENLHIGPSGLLAIVRQRFWTLKGRSSIRKITRQCLKCFRCKPTGIQQLMGVLPYERVNVAAPFEYTGVDFAGPVIVKQGKYRPKTMKAYIAVFICLTTKNIHLELVSDLTADAFVAALERFVNRRGLVRKMLSDNASNFAGAANQLRDLYVLFKDEHTNERIQSFLLPREIEWVFIPPRAPNFGGLWEAGVKSVKTHMKRTLQNAILTFEEFATMLTHIEAILNSRPLYSLSDNPEDPLPITPAHLQIGRPLQCVPKPSCSSTPDNRLSRWRYLDKLREHFWTRWSHEYLSTLQTRGKWTTKTTNVRPGTVVLLIEDNLPPLTWKMGVVTKTYPGSDSLVRVVDVKTSSGVFKRSISKLAPLPIDDNDGNSTSNQSSSASQPRGRMSATILDA